MSLVKRLVRFVRVPRYRLLYGGPWLSTEQLCYELQGRLLTAELGAAPDVPRSGLYRAVGEKFLEEIVPRWQWPEYLLQPPIPFLVRAAQRGKGVAFTGGCSAKPCSRSRKA